MDMEPKFNIEVINTETDEIVYVGQIPAMGLVEVPRYCIRTLKVGLAMKNIRVNVAWAD